MGNKRKETTRYITKDHLRRISNILTDAGILLGEAEQVYREGRSEFAEAFKQMVKIITMLQAMVIDIRDRL